MVIFYSTIVLLLIIYLSIEYIQLSASIKKIPLRILVNGTRGKSTTVKLIYNILRKNGLNVYAKITGDNPILFNPDGSKKELQRFAPTSIKENIKRLRELAKTKPDAMVMECMALHSETQSMLSKFMFKPHHVLIVNVLPDHKEVMGETLEQNLLTILECVDKDSNLIVADSTRSIFQKVKYSNENISFAKTFKFNFEFNNIPKEIIDESWSVIKEISKQLKLDEQIAKDEFLSEWIKIDNSIKIEIPNSNIDIWNLFSVNDISTTQKFIQHSVNYKKNNHIVFILNSRIDRPLRTKEFAEYITTIFPSSKVFLMGNGKLLAKSILVRNYYPKSSIFLVNDEQTISKIKKTISQNSSIYCIGNHQKTEPLRNKLQQLSQNKGVGK